MNFASLLFSTYLDAVSSQVYQHFSDVMGTEIQAMVVEHEGAKVSFQYQLWRIKEASVCGNLKDNALAEFSKCTLAAKSLFEQSCQYLQEHPTAHWQYKKLKNMYCNAALTYKPTTVSIAWSPAKVESALDRAKNECEQLIVAAIGRHDSVVVRKRDVACAKYSSLKGK